MRCLAVAPQAYATVKTLTEANALRFVREKCDPEVAPVPRVLGFCATGGDSTTTISTAPKAERGAEWVLLERAPGIPLCDVPAWADAAPGAESRKPFLEQLVDLIGVLRQHRFPRIGSLGGAAWAADSTAQPSVGKWLDWRWSVGNEAFCCGTAYYRALLRAIADKFDDACSEMDPSTEEAVCARRLLSSEVGGTLARRLRLAASAENAWLTSMLMEPEHGDGDAGDDAGASTCGSCGARGRGAPGGLGYVLTHGDLAPKNIMVDVSTGRFTAVLDWEWSCAAVEDAEFDGLHDFCGSDDEQRWVLALLKERHEVARPARYDDRKPLRSVIGCATDVLFSASVVEGGAAVDTLVELLPE